MSRQSLLWVILLLTTGVGQAGAADDGIRALASRLDVRVFPAEAGQPVTQLFLNNSAVTDDDLAVLEGETGLQVLYLRGTGIGDAGMAHLASLTGLYQLDLTGTRVTDAGLAHLARMSHLAGLQLADTAITDAGLEPIKGLKMLRALNLKGTQVSPAGIEAVRAALPTVRIESSDGLAKGAGVAAEITASRTPATRPRPPTPGPAPCSDLKDVSCLKSELSSGVPKRCVAAANAIAEALNKRTQRGEVGCDPALVKALAPFLVELMKKSGDRCQSEGFSGLEYLGPGIRDVVRAEAVVPFLVSKLDAARASGRWRQEEDSALRILPLFGGGAAPAVPILKEVLADTATDRIRASRQHAAAALGGIGPQARGALPLLFEVMADARSSDWREVAARTASAQAAKDIGAEPGALAEALVPWLTEEEREVRLTARRMLIELGAAAVPAVVKLLPSADEGTRWAGTDVLEAMGATAKPAIPAIIAALTVTGDPDGSFEALLGELGPAEPAHVDALAAALANDDPSVQGRAAAVLGSWGPSAARALPALRRLAASDSKASFAASMAIDSIEGRRD